MSEVTFVLCIENNAIRAQALLLCESIRRFAGRHRDAAIFAVAPRAGFGLDRATQDRLRAMSVEYVEQPLNAICQLYGSANRVYAAGWAEAQVHSEWIVVLDSDTVFFDELPLLHEADAVVRPVDTKGSATAGPGDPFEDYWTRLAALQGVSLDVLPFVATTVTGERVRASYNGGLIAVRRARGILQTWAELFTASVKAGLTPWAGRVPNVYASTGFVGPAASEVLGLEPGRRGAGDLEPHQPRPSLPGYLQRPAASARGPRLGASQKRPAGSRPLSLAVHRATRHGSPHAAAGDRRDSRSDGVDWGPSADRVAGPKAEG